MARAALRLRQKNSAWASWLPHWPTCMCATSREEISLEVRSKREKKGGRGGGGGAAETLSKQVMNNLVVVQQERGNIRLCVCSGKLILAAMYFRRVRIDGRSYAAAPTKFPIAVTPSAPAARNLGVGLRRHCSAHVLRISVNMNGFICTVAS
jgi:hypothetical protein